MLDELKCVYYGKNSKLFDLSFMESLMLELLIKYKNSVLTYEIILKETGISHTNAHTVISRLRKKLKGEFKIYTKKYVGYYL